MLLKDIDTAFLQDAERTIAHDVDVRVRDGEITEIGHGLTGGDVVDCGDAIALPGLINCHCHAPQLFARGWSDDRSLFPWLDANRRVIAAADRSVKRAGARLSAARMLETGTTTVNDMWNTYLVPEFEDLGIRAVMGCALAETEDTDPEALEERVAENRSFAADYRDRPTIHPAVPVHSVYQATGELLETAHGIAAAEDLPFHIHLSETETENEDCLAERGMTPTQWLDHLGVLDRRAILAHVVHLTEADRELIAASGAGIAHCPASNLKLGSGIADLPALSDVPIGIGTDSAASNNSLNAFREGRTAALVHKRDDPGAITAQHVLDMLTCEAAAALGMGDTVGSLEAGKRADVVLVDGSDPTLRPRFGDEGLLSNLIYSFHGRVDAALVNGEFVVEDGSTVTDVDAAIDSVQQFCTAVTDRRDRPG